MVLKRNRKRKLSAVDSDSHPAKRPIRGSPLTRKSPRLTPTIPGCTNASNQQEKENENWPSSPLWSTPLKLALTPTQSPLRPTPRKLALTPTQSPLRSTPRKLAAPPAPSPQKLPPPPQSPGGVQQPAMLVGTFYSRKKSLYLTPLERKMLNEMRSPPKFHVDPYAMPHPLGKGKKKERKGRSQTRRGGGASSIPGGKAAVKGYAASSSSSPSPTISLNTPRPPAAPPAGNKLPAQPQRGGEETQRGGVEEPRRGGVCFSSGLKSRPRTTMFVGAAFFLTGRKPKSTQKKMAAVRRPRKPSLSLERSRPPPQGGGEGGRTQEQREESRPTAPPSGGRTQEREEAVRQAVFVRKQRDTPLTPSRHTDTEEPALHPESSSSGPPSSPRPPSSRALTPPRERYGLTRQLKVVLSRSPTPSHTPLTPSSSEAPDINTQEDFITDQDSDPLFDLTELSSPANTAPCSQATDSSSSSSLYPIFSSAPRRRPRKPSLASPVCCSTPSAGLGGGALAVAAKEMMSLRKRKEPKRQDEDQLIIDAGQRQWGASVCGSCGMVYSADSPEDNFQHTHFHQRLLDSIKFVGWKNERVVAEFWDGKIIMVLPDDPKYALKKAEEVRCLADSELGFQQSSLPRPRLTKTFLFINTHRMVVGCLIAEHIHQAFRVLEQPDRVLDPRREDVLERSRAWCCSARPEAAICGVSRVWVFSLARRQGVATRMLDTVRSRFTYGSPLTKEELAFSDPTPDGKLFATRYCGTPTFLVYNF